MGETERETGNFLHELDKPVFDLVDWSPKQLARRYRLLTWLFPVGHPRRLRALRRLESLTPTRPTSPPAPGGSRRCSTPNCARPRYHAENCGPAPGGCEHGPTWQSAMPFGGCVLCRAPGGDDAATCRQCGGLLSDARAALGLTLCSGACHIAARAGGGGGADAPAPASQQGSQDTDLRGEVDGIASNLARIVRATYKDDPDEAQRSILNAVGLAKSHLDTIPAALAARDADQGALALAAQIEHLCATADEYVAEMRTVTLHPEAAAVLSAFVTLVNRSRAALALASEPGTEEGR